MQIGGLYFNYKDPINRAQPFDEFDKLTENRVSMCLNENCGWVSENKEKDLLESYVQYAAQAAIPPSIKPTLRHMLFSNLKA